MFRLSGVLAWRSILLSALFMLISGLACKAGTTGALTGTITDADSRPVPGVRVDLSSPTALVTAITSAGGTFTFLSLGPDQYTLSTEKDGYESRVVRNVSIFADQTRSLTIVVPRVLRQIGRTSTRLSDIVRPGTTSDVYSVDPAGAEAAQALGDGENLQNAYSALASVPGVFVPTGQQGPNQAIYIRGGNAQEIGYEYDGVPITRAFDGYPASTLSNLGQQELQLYTGSEEPGASSSGTAGSINQVIRTGTYPGFAQVKLGLGAPAFDHYLSVEAGGASPDRNFSYFAGYGGYNQDFRDFDQFNGAGLLDTLGLDNTKFATAGLFPTYRGVYPACTGNPPINDPFAGSPPAAGVANGVGCFSTFGPAFFLLSNIADREGVVNVHVGLPHRQGDGKDDVQILYSTSAQLTQAYSSPNDAGSALVSGLLGGPAIWPDAITWPAGVTFGQSAQGLAAVPYAYPSSPQHAFGAPLPLDQRDSQRYDAGIVKVQYQKNFGSNAYARIFGYSFYSDWSINGPMYFGTGGIFGTSLSDYDYQLDAHTRGVELKVADQLSAQHLISGTVNVVTATTNRFNSADYLDTPDSPVTNLTAGGRCFAYVAGTVSGVNYNAGDPAPCNSDLTSGTFAAPTRGNAPAVGAAAAAGASWRVTESGQQGLWNTVRPTFLSANFDDFFRPNQRLTIDTALRFDRFAYRLADTSSAGQEFWFAAAQNEFCYNPVNNAPALLPVPQNSLAPAPAFIGTTCPIDRSSGVPVQTVHPDGKNGHALLTDVYDHNEVSDAIEPRVGLTYSFNADTVARFSYGRYAEAAPSAIVQYDAKQYNLALILFQDFWASGYTSPRHEAPALFSNNVDASYERQFRGTNLALKISPFYRSSRNELYPGPSISAFSSGTQRNAGVEVEFTKGDFRQNGLSWRLAYTYLTSRERFDNFAGTTQNPLDPFNVAIAGYNALTQAGGGSPCYTANSSDVATPDPTCGPTSIRNPYYASRPQPLLSRSAWYPTGLASPYLVPHVLTIIANERHGRLSITPSLTASAGTVYGSPTDFAGLDPRACTNNSAGLVGSSIATTDPLQADYTSCTDQVSIPSSQTGAFDRFGQYAQPYQLSFNLGVGYDISSRMKLSLTLANIVNRCFGGSRTPWSAAYPPSSVVCAYQANPVYVSNFYNGTSPNDIGANGVPLNPYFAQPFVPAFRDPNIANFTVPFSAYLQLSVKL
ncbi:MAG: TonB-dependent receptor [Candidatus Velthaea sp.]